MNLQRVTGNEDVVSRLFHPRSVAVVGASARAGALSWWPTHLLRRYGFAGEILPVNPNRDEVEGLACRRSIAELDDGVDVAVVVLNAEATDAAVRQLADRGVGVVVLPTQGLGETGAEGAAVEREMIAYAAARGTRVVGPNTDGVGNLGIGMIASIQPLFGEDLPSGEVGVVTQSGATAGSLLARLKREGIGAALYASTGNEADLGWADYMSVVAQHPDVRILLSFVEAIRNVDDFVAVAELAAGLGKPLALIKVGRSEQAARRAAAHTGALAGDDAIYDALFRRLGVIRVDDLGELVAVTKTFLAGGAPRTAGLGVLSVSGGQAGAVTDAAIRRGLVVPPLTAAAESRLDRLLTFGAAFNPCDLTGAVATDPTLAASVFTAFDEEPAIGTVVYARKELTGTAGSEAARNLAKAAQGGDTPLVVYAMDGTVGADERAVWDEYAVPVFDSLHELCVGVRALAGYAEFATSIGEQVRPPMADRHQAVPRSTAEVLSSYALPAPRSELVGTADEAVAAARRIGYPVVLKVADPDIAHKTEIGGVVVDLATDAAVRSAHAAITERARAALGGRDAAAVEVQEQVSGGVEIIVGGKVDRAFGPFVLLGSGGILAELLADAALAPLPLTRADVQEMVASLRSAPLLGGFRGAAPADTEALVDLVVEFAQLLWDHRELVEAIDLNPVVVLERGRGVRVLDALVEWRS